MITIHGLIVVISYSFMTYATMWLCDESSRLPTMHAPVRFSDVD